VGAFHRSGGRDDYAVAITFLPGKPLPISLLTLKLAHRGVAIVSEPVSDVGRGGQGGLCDLAHSHLGVTSRLKRGVRGLYPNCAVVAAQRCGGRRRSRNPGNQPNHVGQGTPGRLVLDKTRRQSWVRTAENRSFATLKPHTRGCAE